MRYVFAFILAISMTGCAVTWGTILAFSAGAVTVAENVAEVATVYKETKEYLTKDNNVSE